MRISRLVRRRETALSIPALLVRTKAREGEGLRQSVVFTIAAVLLATAGAHSAAVRLHRHALPVALNRIATIGWSEDEGVLAKAIAMRAEKLQEQTPFRFDKDWRPKVSLEWQVAGGNGFEGVYKPETETIYFPIHVIYEFNSRQKQAAGALNADAAAQDRQLAELLDHELGHELMDQVSRRNGLGPWFTEQRFDISTREEKLGLDILSEGTALFFQRVSFPQHDGKLSEQLFPATRAEQRSYTYENVAYDGGYWLVRDVLNQYGERGMVWMVRHPFVARDDMRAAAVAYRREALRELASSQPK